MRAKETLQLRHQLSASGLSLRASAYDTRRHHVLTFDSHPLRPHVLRLFSLRRELKSVPLFDAEDIAASSNTTSAAQGPTAATQGRKQSSFFELQQLQVAQEKLRQLPQVEVVVPSMLLQYSPTLDVFVCVYSEAKRQKGSIKVPKTTKHFVVLLEPATLRKLLVYSGPETHSLLCAHYDPLTDRLALASHLTERQEIGQMLPSTPKNVVEILKLSKRLDDRQTTWPAALALQPKTLLFIENTRAALLHPDRLQLICGSRGMRGLYGAASDCCSSVDTTSAVLEWRQNEANGGRFVLVRRVMLRERITAMALSPCGDWLLAGFHRGGLKVWNVNGSGTNGSALFTIDADPYDPTGADVTDAQAEVISSIEVATTSALDSSGDLVTTSGSADVIVIAVGRDTGDVRHWQFSVDRKMFGNDNDASTSGEHRYPRLSLVGYFHAGGKDQMGKEGSPRKFTSQDTLGPPLKTLTMCVTIDMGSCLENLLLVVREDVIHVLKVQTALYVMQEFASIEEVFAVRAIGQQDECKVLSLGSTAACKLRVFSLDEAQASSTTKLLFISPQASAVSAHVSSMETVTNACMQLSFVVLAWSNGVVDVYDVVHERHVLKLHDSQLKDQISALSVVTFQRAVVSKETISLDEAAETGFLSYRSFEHLSQQHTTDPTTYRSSNYSDDAEDQTCRTLIVVGTESGKFFGWSADVLWDGNLTFQSVQKANVRVPVAHSSHVVQLTRIDAQVRGGRALMGSVGADGIVKLWKIPSLKMIGYVNSVVEGYPAAPSCIELMESPAKAVGAPLYVSVGYEDGRLAVWHVDYKRVSFQRLEASTKHERRVSKTCRISSELVPAGLTEFLSCSLDMTVIQWQITASGTVQEKRYFDIGAAIVDMILVKEQAIVALAHEICKFSFAPSSKSDMKYLMKARVETDNLPNEQHRSSAVANPPSDDDEYPSTPTTRSVEDSTEGTIPPHPTSRSVDEYLTLHVPSVVVHREAASPSAVFPENAADSVPVTRALEQDEGQFRSQNERTIKVPRYIRESKSSDKLQRPLVNDEVLREYLQDYIARHGTGGTMAANRITHLLALRPELPSIKRPGFVLAKSLKDLKLTDQARVDSEEALQILRVLFAVSIVSNQSCDAPTMARTLKQEKARAQRMRERKQARRKPVVTYNLLGEKYVQWEETRVKHENREQNQPPSSPTNSLVVHTPNMRDTTEFNEDSLSIDDTGFFNAKMQNSSSSMPKEDDGISESPSIEGITISRHSTPREIPVNILLDENANSVSANTPSVESSQRNLSEEEDDDKEKDGGDGDDSDDKGDDNKNDGGESNNQGNAEATDPDQMDMAQAAPIEITQTTTPVIDAPHRKRTRKLGVSSTNISENALVNGIHLSPKFQQFWTKGYCWCRPAPRLRIVWSSKDDVKNNDKKARDHKADGTRRKEKCKSCHKLLHTVELHRVGYAPHFSRQATFEIIAKVYSKLTATAHSRLYKTASATKERSSECSVFSALFEVFIATYGMRSAVEMKLKLFFVSMCHFLREYDAIAVFGELLGLHTPDDGDEYDQAPSTLVALCVCCYAWLYSRGMVANGDSFSGRLRDPQSGSSYTPANAEVIPATDGTTHWQFVRIEHALLCAQDNLLYPLVSPGFLRNIMLFMQEYAQRLPTRSLRSDSPDVDNGECPAMWIELHRFLRLLVGEWKQQNSEFRVVERLLFVYPQRSAAIEGNILDRLHLLLSCFVFYDHARVGAMAISDFESLLYKLRYLWSEERVEQASKVTEFEKAILATKKRFVDLNHDGQLCYLDFWTMLYIVGMKTRGLIQFCEMPSFCRDYRLEVSSELSDMVWSYMQLSCTLLLPKGLQVGKSSLDQKAERQHRRRVGGLHDGTFHIAKTLKGSLSTQELLASDETKRLGLFLDGTTPATRQTASTTALDRFRPVSVEVNFDSNGSSSRRGREPVVGGVRSTGPTPKPVAPLRVSFMGNFDLQSAADMNNGNCAGIQQANSRRLNGITSRDSTTAYTNMYIQFPQVPPVRRRVGGGLHEMAVYSARQIAGNIPMEEDSDEDSIVYDESVLQREEEQVEIPIATTPSLTRALSVRSLVSMADMPPLAEETQVAADPPESPKPALEKRRSTTAVVVVPTIETAALLSQANSRTDLLTRPSSRGLQRAVSERLKLEETATQLEAETMSSRSRQPSTIPVETTRDEIPPGSESDDNQSEVSDDEPKIEEPDKQPDEECQQMEPEESVPIPVEESPPEPEPVVEVHVEPTVESIVVQPSVEEVVVVDEVESTPEPEFYSEPVIEIEVVAEAEVVNEEVRPAPVEEPPARMEEAPAVNLEEDTEDVTEDVLDATVDPPHSPQVIKEVDIQIHRAFRFSQQPTFLHSIAVTNNPYRTAMWNPDDDSDSDADEVEKSSESKKPLTSSVDRFAMDESTYSSDDEVNTAAASQLSPPTLSSSPQTSLTHLSRLDNKLQPTQRVKRDKHANSLDYHFSGDLEAIQDEAEDDLGGISDALCKPVRRTRLDEDAERALYGERIVNVLGEGIAFSPEAEVARQHKWQQFFDDSESKMFATMRHDLEKKQTEQREAEERQRKLRKKWQEQRDQDLLRLQSSRQTSVLLSSTNTAATNGGVDASFRQRRIHRESCRQLTEELQLGVSVQRELTAVTATEFFYFYYLPDGHGSIVTLKMHVLRGDAEVFMSTDTKVPCATDFMWRSSERLAKDSGEGQRIVLYPHDLLRVVTAASTNAAHTEQAAAIAENNASTASLRSFYPKQLDVTPLRVEFYLSVVALEPGTTFTLAVMSSGQKMQPTRAIQTVDYLIDRFNMLSRSFQGQSFSLTSGSMLPKGELEREIASRQCASHGSDSHMMDENEGESDEEDTTNANEAGGDTTKTVAADPQELKSFQYLLETLSEKKGFGSPRAASILLAGPSEEHLEFVQDEAQRLKEMHQLLSPPKNCPGGVPGGHDDSISVITERRLTLQGKRQKLRRVVAARLQQKLAPLRHKSVAGGDLEKSASTGALTNMRIAKTDPRPVAYSLTSLDPLPRSQRFKATATTLPQTSRSSAIEKRVEALLKD